MGLFDDIHHLAEMNKLLVQNNKLLSQLLDQLKKLDKSVNMLNDTVKKQNLETPKTGFK